MALAEIIFAELKPIQEEYAKLIQERGYIDEIIQQNEECIRDIARKTYNKAKSLVGLI